MVAEKGVRKIIPDVTTDAQYSQCFIETQSEWVEPIHYADQIAGVIDIEEDQKNAFGESDEIIFRNLASQVGPLFAWTDTPWPSRLQILRKLFDLKKRYKVFDWVGIYRIHPKLKDTLELATYLGAPTDHIRIPISKGICGAAIREERTLNIPNVKSDPRFIACSLSTESELVVPIRNLAGKIVAEIDIDSDEPNAFSNTHIASVEACAQQIGRILEFGA
jgi:GAF domain-containing protein